MGISQIQVLVIPKILKMVLTASYPVLVIMNFSKGNALAIKGRSSYLIQWTSRQRWYKSKSWLSDKIKGCKTFGLLESYLILQFWTLRTYLNLKHIRSNSNLSPGAVLFFINTVFFLAREEYLHFKSIKNTFTIVSIYFFNIKILYLCSIFITYHLIIRN